MMTLHVVTCWEAKDMTPPLPHFDFDFSIWGDSTVPEQIARSRLGSSINVQN